VYKSHTRAYRDMFQRTLNHFWEWSQQGRLPIVLDASSCAYTLQLRSSGDTLPSADRVRWEKLTILDPIEHAYDGLLPHLETVPSPKRSSCTPTVPDANWVCKKNYAPLSGATKSEVNKLKLSWSLLSNGEWRTVFQDAYQVWLQHRKPGLQ